MTLDTLMLITTLLFGASVGSFLNVVAYRSVHGGSIFFGRSMCPNCGHKLETKDLVPIFSFILLRGKCRYCKKNISRQYPIVEGATALLFLLSAIIFNKSGSLSIDFFTLVYFWLVIATLVVVFVTDIKDGVIPDKIVFPAAGIVLLIKFILLLLQETSPLLLSEGHAPDIQQIGVDVLAGLAAGMFFYLIVLVSRGRGMGGGDIKFAAFLGISLGFLKLTVALFLAFLTGASVALILIWIGRKRFGQTVPFGPFLSFGALVSLLWGKQILDWYLMLNR